MKENPLSFHLNLNPEDFLPATDEEKQRIEDDLDDIIYSKPVAFVKKIQRRIKKHPASFLMMLGVIF